MSRVLLLSQVTRYPPTGEIVNDPSSPATFTWKFNYCGKKSIFSEIFTFRGYKWFLIYRWRSSKLEDHLSVYLYAAKLPPKGNGLVGFQLAVINQIDKSLSVRKLVQHRFVPDARYMGFRQLIPLKNLNNKTGFLLGDTCILEVKFSMDEKDSGASGKSGVKTKESECRDTHTKDLRCANIKDKPSEESPRKSGDKEMSNEGDGMNLVFLFKEIAKVIDDPNFADLNMEISRPLSLLNELSSRSFSEISSQFRYEMTSALQTLRLDKSLLPDQASAIRDFSKQFGDICESYNSSVTASTAVQQYFDTKKDRFLSLKMFHESQSKIMKSLSDIREEKNGLQKRLREAGRRESELLKEYGIIGRESKLAKSEWDYMIVNNAAMVEHRQKLRNDMAHADTMWNDFIYHFK